jgi:hypothetical protein
MQKHYRGLLDDLETEGRLEFAPGKGRDRLPITFKNLRPSGKYASSNRIRAPRTLLAVLDPEPRPCSSKEQRQRLDERPTQHPVEVLGRHDDRRRS